MNLMEPVSDTFSGHQYLACIYGQDKCILLIFVNSDLFEVSVEEDEQLYYHLEKIEILTIKFLNPFVV